MDSLSFGTERMIARAEGPIGWLVFNNPDRHNAVSMDMWEAVPPILERFNADPAIRVVAVTGAGGRAFVSGADISELARQRSNAEEAVTYAELSRRALDAITMFSKPTVAVIQGWCIGGGLAVAAACDVRFSSAGSKFGIPASRLGLGYEYAGVKQVMDIVGPACTKEIFFTARHFTAQEAWMMGLLNRVVPDDELAGFANEQLATISDNAPLTLKALKRAVHELGRGSESDFAVCQKLIAACFASDDFKEGRLAFNEKRPPVFRGR
jgi:enoyl-CoA hydratase